jgi:putative phosphoesterase
MRIGVVSDTHDNLPNVAEIVDLLNAASVERVVHTGDITSAKTLRALSRLRSPLVGVYGNNDLERESLCEAAAELGFELADPPLELHWAGRHIVVVHDTTEHEPEDLHAGDVLLHGHDHFRRAEMVGGTLIFNPGECSGQIKGQNAIGVLDLAQLQIELLHF